MPRVAIALFLMLAGAQVPAQEADLRQAAEKGGEEGRAARYRLAELMLANNRPAEAVDLARAALRDEPPDVEPARSARVLLCRAKAKVPETVASPAAAAPPSSTPPPVSPAGKIQSPKLFYHPLPIDPEGSYRRTPSDVIVQATIDEEGCVHATKVVHGSTPARDRVAVEAVRGWTFRPAFFNGKAVPVVDFAVIVPFGARHAHP
jgi:TonB family protein